MDWVLPLALMLGGLGALLVLGVPVAFAFLAVTVAGAWEVLGGDRGLVQLARSAAQGIANFQLAPIPLFILMGELLFQSGVARRAIDAIEGVVTRIPGRLSVVTVFGGTIFAALSGSTIANTAMLGSTLLPRMLSKGYHPSMAMGPIMASGAIAMLIPPSALAVLVGSLAGISIAGLMVAGVLPALLLSGLFVAYIAVRCTMSPELAPADDSEVVTSAQRWRPFLVYVAPLSLVFVVVIGSLLLGLATPTESAALGCVAALGASAAYGSLTRESVGRALMETVKLSAMILFIIVASQTFSQVLSFSGATSGLIQTIERYHLSEIEVLLGIIALLLFLGCFIDQVSMLMVTVPIFVPLATKAGIDPLVLGVVYLLTMEIALLTPPFGLLLFVMRGVAPEGFGMRQVYAAVGPFLIIKLMVLAVLVSQPGLGTWLPELVVR